MASTTHSNFGANTEALEVARAFSTGVQGKTVLITGANINGIGGATAMAFASQSPANLILAGRTVSKIDECIAAIKKDFPNTKTNFRALHLDLASQKSIRTAAAEFLSWADVPTLDILVNSAGVMGIPTHTLTPEGIEMHFGSNHIGHFLFTNLISPKLFKSAEHGPKGSTRVVNVSSASPTIAGMRWSDINFNKVNNTLPESEQPNYTWLQGWGYKNPQGASYLPIDAYNRSKVANVLFGIAANKRWFENYGVLTLAVHPGIIMTELQRDFADETREALSQMKEKGRLTFKTQGAGAATSVVAALDPALAQGVGLSKDGKENYGAYLADCQVSGAADPRAIGSKEAERLWVLSEDLVGEKFA